MTEPADNSPHLRPILLLRLLLRAVLRAIGIYRIRGLQHLDVLVISSGGAGSTLLIDELARHLRVNSRNDSDDLKHLPRLPDRFPSEIKVVYLYGEVDEVVASIHRRGWIAAHGSKLGSIRSVLASSRSQAKGLGEAVQRQIDWFSHCGRSNLLLVRYAELWDRLEEVATFVGIDADRFTKEFPPDRGRTGGSA